MKRFMKKYPARFTMDRLSREQYFMDIAILTGKRGTCNRALVGAIAVKDNRIIMSGYNGSPKGLSHCTTGHKLVNKHCIRTVHAEQNIICSAAKFGVSLKDCTIYTTLQPCFECLKLLISVGITKVIFLELKEDDRTPNEYYTLIEVEKYGPRP